MGETTPLSPPPAQAPLTDRQTGMAARPWFQFFQALWLRVGGANALDNVALAGGVEDNSGAIDDTNSALDATNATLQETIVQVNANSAAIATLEDASAEHGTRLDAAEAALVVLTADLDALTLRVEAIEARFAAVAALTPLTDNTGGVANTVVEALPAPADSPASADALRDDLAANLIPALRNDLADLTARVNQLRAALAA